MVQGVGTAVKGAGELRHQGAPHPGPAVAASVPSVIGWRDVAGSGGSFSRGRRQADFKRVLRRRVAAVVRAHHGPLRQSGTAVPTAAAQHAGL